MEHRYLKNFDRVYTWAEKLGEFAAFGYAGDQMIDDVRMYPLHMGRTYGMEGMTGGRHCRALGSAGRHGYLIVSEHGDYIASAAYKNSRLYREEDFLELFRASLLSGLPVMSLIELLDVAVVDGDEDAINVYRAIAPTIESGIEALMEWDA